MIALNQGSVIAGKYVLERPLARGGMGSVWVARHRELDMTVAIKFMDHALISSEDARARFEREAKAAAQLDTKHVVKVQDYGVDEGTPYIVMELLKGEDLATRLAHGRRISVRETAAILTQVARALRKAHEASLVHRDLKPANIFLAFKDDEEVAKVLDFGIAKATGSGLAGKATQTGALIGSVHYMSPEQARRSKEVDHRSDLWSLGVILFRALTGKLPFPGDEVGDVIVKVCAEPVPVPSQIAPDLPEEIDRFFERALARPASERFQSVQQMTEAFVAAMAAASAPRIAQESGTVELEVLIGNDGEELPRVEATGPVPMQGAAEGDRASSEPTALQKTKLWQPTVEPRRSEPGTLNPAQRTLTTSGARSRKVLVLLAGLGVLVVGALGIGFGLESTSSKPSADAASAGVPRTAMPPASSPVLPAPPPASSSAAAPSPTSSASTVVPQEPPHSAKAATAVLPQVRPSADVSKSPPVAKPATTSKEKPLELP